MFRLRPVPGLAAALLLWGPPAFADIVLTLHNGTGYELAVSWTGPCPGDALSAEELPCPEGRPCVSAITLGSHARIPPLPKDGSRTVFWLRHGEAATFRCATPDEDFAGEFHLDRLGARDTLVIKGLTIHVLPF